MLKKCMLIIALLLLLAGCQDRGEGTRISMDFALQEGETAGRVKELPLYIRKGDSSLSLEGYIELDGPASLSILSDEDGEVLYESSFGMAENRSKEDVTIALESVEPGYYKLVLNGLEAKEAKLFLSSAQSFVKPVFAPKKPAKAVPSTERKGQ